MFRDLETVKSVFHVNLDADPLFNGILIEIRPTRVLGACGGLPESLKQRYFMSRYDWKAIGAGFRRFPEKKSFFFHIDII